jgi:hypothetical protein
MPVFGGGIVVPARPAVNRKLAPASGAVMMTSLPAHPLRALR